MKKLLLVVLILFSTDILAQQMAYNVVYVRAEENSEWQIGNLIETYYTCLLYTSPSPRDDR